MVLLLASQAPTPVGAATTPTATVVPSPNQNANDNVLFGVDGSGPADVWAAGYALNEPRGGGTRSVLMRFDGSAWSLVDHPRPGSIDRLLDVDALTASDAWAVGNSNAAAGQPGRTLTLRWNGSAWTTVASPNATGSNALNAVEAASTNDVWAVGSHQPDGGFSTMPLVMRWNGTAWRIVPTPVSVQGFALNAVDATSSTNAWAVGTKIASPIVGGYSATAIRWNGTAWQEVPIPNPANLTLNGVATLGPNDVWAVGARIGAPNAVPVTLHWDGSGWTQVDTPVRSPDGGELADVVAVSSSTLYAVGSAIANGVERTLFLRGNGSAWTEIPAPPGGSEPRLRGVTAIGDRTAWAVGSRRIGPRVDPGPQRTLTIRATT